MIAGIGCDICEISRFEDLKEAFFTRNYSKDEQAMLAKKKPQSAAANFAVKEAFSKALGTGVRGFRLCEAEVLRDELGAPYIRLSGNAEKICKGMGITDIHVSISHDGNMAQGFVVLEKRSGSNESML